VEIKLNNKMQDYCNRASNKRNNNKKIERKNIKKHWMKRKEKLGEAIRC
jgi:hypothetical protein